jgi:hypothetical protein
MTEGAQPRFTIPFSIIVSTLGLIIALGLALNPAQTTQTSFSWQKSLVGSIFTLICLFGIAVALSPGKCALGKHGKEKSEVSGLLTSNAPYLIKGHHYNCGRFRAHTILIDGHTLCAACTGLLLGGVGAILGTTVYFFAGYEIERSAFLTVLIGMSGIILGFFQLKFGGLVRMMLNVFFVLGSFLVLVGMDGLTGSLLADLFSITLIAFWLFTRILLSQWDHWRTCRTCPATCEISDKRKWGSVSSAPSVHGADN